MFGYVAANRCELTEAQKTRYGGIYCGICRCIQKQSGQLCRLCLSYDMVFLAALLMSLYEPEEHSGLDLCLPHPIRKRLWLENDCIAYAADMNVALGYYNLLDDWQDDRHVPARVMAGHFQKSLPRIQDAYPRQCEAIRTCIRELNDLESEGCTNPDLPANCFGWLMGELMVLQEDLWAPTLRRLGFHLGRFIYLADAAVDYRKDIKKQKYNPFAAMGLPRDPARWEEYLILAMGQCADSFERLPLVQDKEILDNILYSGVWAAYRAKQKEPRAQEEQHDR